MVGERRAAHRVRVRPAGALEPGLRGRATGRGTLARPPPRPLAHVPSPPCQFLAPEWNRGYLARVARGSLTSSACPSTSGCAACRPRWRARSPRSTATVVCTPHTPANRRPRPPHETARPRAPSDRARHLRPAAPRRPACPSRIVEHTTPPGPTHGLKSSQSRAAALGRVVAVDEDESTGSAQRRPTSWLRSTCQRTVGPPRSRTARSTTRVSGPRAAAPAGAEAAAVDEGVDQVQHRAAAGGGRARAPRSPRDADLDATRRPSASARSGRASAWGVHQPRRDDPSCPRSARAGARRARIPAGREAAEGLGQRHRAPRLTWRACPPASTSPSSRSAPRWPAQRRRGAGRAAGGGRAELRGGPRADGATGRLRRQITVIDLVEGLAARRAARATRGGAR